MISDHGHVPHHLDSMLNHIINPDVAFDDKSILSNAAADAEALEAAAAAPLDDFHGGFVGHAAANRSGLFC